MAITSNLKPPPVHRIIVVQLVVAALSAALFLVFSNVTAAYSSLIGGLVSAIPNGFFMVQAFRFRGARNAEKVVKSFLKGEIGKITITVLLFVLAFTLIRTLDVVALIGGFVVTMLAGIVMSGTINYNPGAQNG
jgi:ATP synthase protein I